jgi:hypothetical protein
MEIFRRGLYRCYQLRTPLKPFVGWTNAEALLAAENEALQKLPPSTPEWKAQAERTRVLAVDLRDVGVCLARGIEPLGWRGNGVWHIAPVPLRDAVLAAFGIEDDAGNAFVCSPVNFPWLTETVFAQTMVKVPGYTEGTLDGFPTY